MAVSDLMGSVDAVWLNVFVREFLNRLARLFFLNFADFWDAPFDDLLGLVYVGDCAVISNI